MRSEATPNGTPRQLEAIALVFALQESLKRTAHALAVAIQHMRIDHRRRHIRMTRQRRHGANLIGGVHKGGFKRVAQAPTVHLLRDTSALRRGLNSLLQAVLVHVMLPRFAAGQEPGRAGERAALVCAARGGVCEGDAAATAGGADARGHRRIPRRADARLREQRFLARRRGARRRAGSCRPLFGTGSGCCATVPAQPSRSNVWNCSTPSTSSPACPPVSIVGNETAPRR